MEVVKKVKLMLSFLFLYALALAILGLFVFGVVVFFVMLFVMALIVSWYRSVKRRMIEKGSWCPK